MKLNIGDQVIIVGDPRAGGPHIGSNHKIGDKGIVIEIDEEHHFGAWPYFIEVKNITM